MEWMTDDLLERTKKFLDTNPLGDKRATLARLFDITEHKARELLRKAQVNGPTWGIFDIETTDLEGHFGRMLCCSVLTYPSMEMRTFRWDDYSDDPSDDSVLVTKARDHIESHNISCGWYTKGFDIGFIRARLAACGERLLKPMLHFDPMWGYKGWRGVKIGSASLKNVSEFLGLSEQKMAVPKEVWVKAGMGNKEALDILVDRCESDVRVTWECAQHCLNNQLLKTPIQMYP